MTANPTPLPRLDPLLHQPVRTQIVAFLSGRGEATFSELKRALAITDGNLGAHLNKLVEAAFIESRDVSVTARSQTVFLLTATGRAALADYVAQLTELVRVSGASSRPADGLVLLPLSHPQECP
ncbi:transcriptional regulator [Sphaerotilus sp.]|uniref:transcriptional regulator n=1 Tax=Sphaerotilus sp. TaxID=2093942 RepID=UPI0034E1F1DD